MSSANGELHAGFARPNPEFSPTPIWWWSGERVTLDRLCWQLDQLVEQGVFNTVVLNLAPTGPVTGSLADDPPLFSEEWWELWSGLCAHARTRGARLWFYDQIGFSGANLQGWLVLDEPEFAGASLERVVEDVDGPVELSCPSAGRPIAASAVPLDDSDAVSGSPISIPLSESGTAVWSGEQSGKHRVVLAYSLSQGFDYTSPRACAALIDLVHGEFERRLGEYIGDVIVGSFQDELPSMPTWSARFAEEFERRCGYRIEPVVAALWEDWGTESSRVRADYQRVRGALSEEAFFIPLYEWHDRLGLTVGVDQQGPSRQGEPLGTVRQYADYTRTHRWFSAPGSDHHGDAKIHSSLAHHYERPRTWIESFHTSGWGGTIEETFDWLVPWLLAGATLYDPHAVYYSTRGGWWEWAPPSTCWRQPYWRHYKQFADTVSRLCWLLTRGDHVCDVGVLFPSATVSAGTFLEGQLSSAQRAHRGYLELIGRMCWFNAKYGVLNRANWDFDVLDDDTTANATIVDGALRTRTESYRAIVLPYCGFLEAATARVLADFVADGGLLVVVGDRPEHVIGAPADSGAESIEQLNSYLDSGRAVWVADPEDVPAVLDRLGRRVVVDGPSLSRRVGEWNVLVIPAADNGSATSQPMLPDDGHWVGGLREGGYDFDATRFRTKAVVRLDGEISEVEQWDPVTGTSRQVAVSTSDDGTELTVDFDSAPLAVLVWRQPGGALADTSRTGSDRESGSAPGAWDASAGVTELRLDGQWSSQLVPTIDNRHGDMALPADDDAFPVQQWRAEYRRDSEGGAGAGDWSELLVGYGTFAWMRGPSDTDWRPVKYSLSRGIENDPAHLSMLGPKGRVPEEFWQADLKAGEVVELRTDLPCDEGEFTLAIGTNGAAEVWWNDEQLAPDPGGYLRMDTVRANAGPNRLALRVAAERDGAVRGFWALTTDAETFARPEWLMPGDESVNGTEVKVRGVCTVRETAWASAVLQLGTEGPARLLVNGTEVATQGAFEPYGGQNRVLPYDITRYLRGGENVVEVVLTDVGRLPAVFADGVLTYQDGSTDWISTDRSWAFTRDGAAVPTVLKRQQVYDPRWAVLRARPHPLPRTDWIEPAGEGVLDIVPDARTGAAKPVERFRLAVPPGATSAVLPVDRNALVSLEVSLAGHTLTVSDDGRVELPDSEQEHRLLEVAMRPNDGRTEGALWDGPITFDCAEGRLSEGPWDAVGLGSYSGGVRYRREFDLDSVPGHVGLDLGTVRGTVEVSVNDRPVGVRVWSPYRFDLTELVHEGTNALEVTVFNTLGPYVDDASPTMAVFPGQRLSGLLGPARLVLGQGE